jgi:hypothetical protein
MSCSCDGESPSCFRQVIRKARRNHKCYECLGEIVPGERYEYSSGVWDGEPASFKVCLSCADAREEVYLVIGEMPDFGSVGCCYREMLRESVGCEKND